MKNIFKSFAAFVFAALAISSCANSELVPETPKGPTHTVKFTAGVPETKTNMNIDPDSKAVTYSWTNDDLTRLAVYENGFEGQIDVEKSTISATSLVIYATFEGEPTDDAKEYTAVLNGVVGNQTPRVEDKSYDEEADVLVAKPITATAAEGIEFQFRRAVAVNKMNLLDLPAGETLSTVTITSDQPISGIIDGNDWSEELLENTIVLTVNKEIPADGKLTLYYMAIPVEGAILTVDAKIGADSYLKRFDKTLTTEAGNVKGYSVGLKKMETKIYTLTFNSFTSGEQTISSTTKASTFITEGTTYVTAQPFSDVSNCFYGGDNTNGKPLRVGKTSEAGSITMALSDEGKAKATKIILSAKQYNSGRTKKIGVNDLDKQQPGDNYGDLTFNLDGSKISAIKLDSDGYIFVKSITVESYGEAEPAINANDISDVAAIGVTGATFNFSVVNIIGTPTATPDGVIVTDASANGNTVTYTVSKNETYAPREGSIIIKVGEESKTVLVSQLGIVPDYEGKGTLESPYTVADALLKIETLAPGTSSEKVYVAGPIKSIESFNSTYGSITYVIGESETTLDVFGGLDFGGVKFSAVSDLSEGQTVVVYGSLKDYSGTKEMDSNNELVSVNGKIYLLKSISVTGAKDKFDQGDSFSNEGAIVTAYYRGTKDNTTVTEHSTFSGYDGTKLGLQDITVSYTEDDITKTTTYQVSVANATPISINVADYDSSKGEVTVTAGGVPVTEAKIGTEIVVTVTTETGFVVDEFTVNGQSQTLTNGIYQFTMSEEEVTIAVTFKEKPAGYTRITSINDLTTGQYVIVAYNGSKYYALPQDFTGTPFGVEISVSNNEIDANVGASYVFSIIKNTSDYTIKNSSGDVVCYGSSGTSITKSGQKNTWTISAAPTLQNNMKGGTFAINNATTTNRYLLFNNETSKGDENHKFGAYTNTDTNNNYYYLELFQYAGGFEPGSDPVTLTDPDDFECANSGENENTLTFTWTTDPNASSYEVKVGSGQWKAASGDGTHTESGLIAGTTYTLYIRAVGDGINHITSSGTKSATGTTKSSGGSSPTNHDVEKTLTDATSPQSLDSNITLTFEQDEGTSKPAWYGSEVRTYENNQTTLSCDGGLITKIVFTYSISNSGSLTPSVGSYDSSKKTWTGSSESVTFTTGHSSGTKNGQVRISKIEVFYTK